MSNTILLPFRPDSMTPAQLAAVSYLAKTLFTPDDVYDAHRGRALGAFLATGSTERSEDVSCPL